jgi:hypothetical protein
VLNGQGALTDKKKVTLGTQPTVLRKFRWHLTCKPFVRKSFNLITDLVLGYFLD